MKKIICILCLILLLTGCQKQSEPDKVEAVTEHSVVASSSPPAESTPSSQPQTEVKTWASGSLLMAVEQADLETAQSILLSPSYVLDETNEKGETPLLIAVHQNDIPIATLLIQSGADINKQDAISDSPYLFAGAEGRTEILKIMLEQASPDYSLTNRYGGNALIPAAEKGHIDAVWLLLEHGKEDVNHINRLGYTALLEAVALTDGSQVYQDIVGLLLQHGADPNIRDNQGRTARDHAGQKGFSELLEVLDQAEFSD